MNKNTMPKNNSVVVTSERQDYPWNAQSMSELFHLKPGMRSANKNQLEKWSKALEQRDHGTIGHTIRVTQLTLKLAHVMEVPKELEAKILLGSLLHDMGKLSIPDHILFKPGPLNDEEWEIMRQHPTKAFELLSSIPELQIAVEIPYCHHERWDGNGYPRGLKGAEIPFVARIFSIIDVWDALTSDRPYRNAWSPDQALNYIEASSGAQFDPQVVEAFLYMVATDLVFRTESYYLPLNCR